MIRPRLLRLAALVFGLAVAHSVSAASLVGSVHDLDAGPAAGQDQAGDLGANRSCMYCHTPRSAGRSMGARWNSGASVQPFALSDAICLNCHDGAVAADALAGMPGGAQPQGSPPGSGTETGLSLTFAAELGSDGRPGSTHPVGVHYAFASDLVPAPPDGRFPNGVRLIDGKVECGTCHNPHNAANPPFLATPNAGSALCYTCHIK